MTVKRRDRDGLLQVDLWKWLASEGPDGRPYHYGSPTGTSSIVDSEQAARRVAKGRVEEISGEPLNLTPETLTIDWTRERSGDSSA